MTTEQRRAEARRLYVAEDMTVREVAEHLGISVGTAHRDINPDAAERYRIATRERRRNKKGLDAK